MTIHCPCDGAARPSLRKNRYRGRCTVSPWTLCGVKFCHAGRKTPKTRLNGRSGNPVLLHLIEEGAVADLQQLRCVRAVAMGGVERAPDEVAFERTCELLDG